MMGALLAQAARRWPDELAVVDGPARLTYAELHESARLVAGGLRAQGVRPGDRVGLRMDRSADRIVAMLGITGLGAAYVPLEPGIPEKRLRHVAAECAVRLVLVDAVLSWAGGEKTVSYREIAQTDAGPVEVTSWPEAPWYVPYTSGSTGRPKGVVVPQRSIPGFFLGADYATWGPGTVVSHHSALSWDAHLLDLFPALSNGGTVVVFPAGMADPVSVLAYAATHGVTTMFLATQAFNTVAGIDPAMFSALRTVIIGGERAAADHVGRVLAAVPDLRVVNIYGPVECTVLATAHVITDADIARGVIPIGRPVGDREVRIVDENGQQADEGEIHIGGPGVAQGYLAQAALTAAAFTPDHEGKLWYRTGDLGRRDTDGLLYFAGRRDDQVKLRGFRVEPGEIAAALRRHPAVEDAAVFVDDNARLVAYVVCEDEPPDLKTHLADHLPAAMIPVVITRVGSVPVNHHGKLDTRSPAPQAPVTALEEELAELWRDLLEVSVIGRADDFFALGGHSLLATRLVARIRQRFEVDIQVRDVYRAPTLLSLGESIAALRLSGSSAPSIKRATRTRRRSAP